MVLFLNSSCFAGKLSTSTSTSYQAFSIETKEKTTGISMFDQAVALRWQGKLGATTNINTNLYLHYLKFLQDESFTKSSFQLRPTLNVALQGRMYRLMGGYSFFNSLQSLSKEAESSKIFLTTATSYANLKLGISGLPHLTLFYSKQDRASNPFLSPIESSRTSFSLGANYQLGPVGLYVNRSQVSLEDYTKEPSYVKRNYCTLGRINFSLKPIKPVRIGAKYQIEDTKTRELESSKSVLSQFWDLDLSFRLTKGLTLNGNHRAKKMKGDRNVPSSLNTSNTLSLQAKLLSSLTLEGGYKLTDMQKEEPWEEISTAETYLSLYAIPIQTIRSFLTLSRAYTLKKPKMSRSRVDTGSLKMITKPFENVRFSFNYTISNNLSSGKNILTISQGRELQVKVTDNLDLDLGYSISWTEGSSDEDSTEESTTSRASFNWQISPRLSLSGKYEELQKGETEDTSTGRSFSVDLDWFRREFYHFNLKYTRYIESGAGSNNSQVSKEDTTAQIRLNLSQATSLVLDYKIEKENGTNTQQLALKWNVNL